MTKYRIISIDGIYSYLQYLKEYKFLFFKWKKWKLIKNATLDPYCLEVEYISSYKYNIQSFVSRYNDINEYLNIDYPYSMKELYIKDKNFWKKLDDKKKEIKYL